jgi:hypothetical protein
MNKVVEHRFQTLCKNFYNDMYDVIEKYNLSDEEAFIGLATGMSMITICTFREDTPEFIKGLSKQYKTIGKEVIEEMNTWRK